MFKAILQVPVQLRLDNKTLPPKTKNQSEFPSHLPGFLCEVVQLQGTPCLRGAALKGSHTRSS